MSATVHLRRVGAARRAAAARAVEFRLRIGVEVIELAGTATIIDQGSTKTGL